jgi:hypothetical protein
MKSSTKLKSLILFVTAIVILSSCHNRTIKGSGTISSETRSVSGFKSIDVSSALTVIYTEGTDYKVEVFADDNLIKYITTEIKGDELQIGIQEHKSFKKVTKTEIHVTSPAISGIEASGASVFNATNTLHATDLTLHLSGASVADLTIESSSLKGHLSGASNASIDGSTNFCTLEASGASIYQMEDFTTSTVSVDFSGASSGSIKVENSLSASLSGASTLSYYGNPTITYINTSGSSSVIKK